MGKASDLKERIRAAESTDFVEQVSGAVGEVKAKKYPSAIMTKRGTPVVLYDSKADRDKYDKMYKVRVTDLMRGQEGDRGTASVGVNGYKYSFFLGADVDMYGFQIAALRSCTFPDRKMKVDNEGNLKPDGMFERSRFSVEVIDDF